MKNSVQISDAEWRLMHVIWQDQPIEAQQVIDQVAGPNGWSAATVKTMLHRLMKKGVLAVEREGKRYLYRACARRSDCVRRESRSFLDRVFGGSAAPALLHLARHANLSEEEANQLRQILDNKEGRS